MTLESRIVFIDTSVYFSNNYKFGQHGLWKLQELLKTGSVTLLITDITKDEINIKLEDSYKSILSQKNPLRNKKTKDEILLKATKKIDNIDNLNNKLTKKKEFVTKKFKYLLEETNCTFLKATDIDAKTVFSLYFNKRPPFGEGRKKSEFPDAFVLERIRQYAEEKNKKVYIISTDNDMKTYTEEYENLIYLNNLKDYIDLVVRADDKKEKDIQDFADNAFEKLQPELVSQAKEHLKQGDFIHNDLDFDLWLDENCTLNEIIDIKILNKELFDISEEHANYEVELLCIFKFSYSEPDPDSISEDGDTKECYSCSIITTATYSEKYSAVLDIDYDFEKQEDAEITGFEFIDETFILNKENSKEINRVIEHED